jgi:cytochrome P450
MRQPPPSARLRSRAGHAGVVSLAPDAADLLDFDDPATVADPYPHFAALRSQAPVAWHSGAGMYLATSHAAAGEALRNRRLGRLFTPRVPEEEWATFNWLHADSILDSEPPKHTRLRRLVSGAFARGHVARLAPRIQELATDLLDGCATDGPFDVLAGYAEPLPVLVIAELLGWPAEDRHLLRQWSQAIVRMYEVDHSTGRADRERAARRAAGEFAAYVEGLAADRAAQPGDDLLSHLVQARDGGDRLTTRELVATTVLLLNAGHEASVNGFGNGLHSLLTSGRMAAAVDAGLDDGAVARLVEEFLRHDSPLQLFERTATAPARVGGVTVEPGETVAALLGAANRDPAVFAEPDVFDPGREPNPHLAFGAGIHFCIGAPLARLELQVSVGTLLARYPGLDLVEAARRPTFVLRGFERLVVSPGG